MKRKNSEECDTEYECKKQKIDNGITYDFISKCDIEFENNPSNSIIRNAVTKIGVKYASINIDEENKISHVFTHSLHSPHAKATDQANTGRCWMFAGLNVLRHNFMDKLKLDNFEFSETFLFFWDKFERANNLLQWHIDNPHKSAYDRESEIINSWGSADGGFWNYFVNLVTKYGLVPKSVMKETFSCIKSNEMNTILSTRLISCISYIHKLQNKQNITTDELLNVKTECLQQIYESLVKMFGLPPIEFDWSFNSTDQCINRITRLSPMEFKQLVLGDTDLNDFVLLTNIPNKSKPFYTKYQINNSTNMYNGNLCEFINLPIDELKKYAHKQIISGTPVWFAGDVTKGYHSFRGVLDEQLFDEDLLFGEAYDMTKEEKITYGLISGNHAMSLIGVDVDNKKASKWEVENSWGYHDGEPGTNGFLSMSNQWFDNNLMEIVIHKDHLSRNVLKILEQEPIKLHMWDEVASAVMIKPVNKYDFLNYKKN
jgi:bleomycin hydrolase